MLKTCPGRQTGSWKLPLVLEKHADVSAKFAFLCCRALFAVAFHRASICLGPFAIVVAFSVQV
jgi:hypothetical protein